MEQARPRGGHRGAGGPTYWALRLLVAISMVAGLVAEGVTPAAAAAPALWSQVTGAGGPSTLAGTPMAYDPATGQTIMFGGTANGTTTGPQAGTWDWNGSTWAALNPPSSPTARYGASLAYDTTTSQLLLFGGYNGTIYMSDTWSWTGSTWEQLSPTTSPTARYGASLAFDGSAAKWSSSAAGRAPAPRSRTPGPGAGATGRSSPRRRAPALSATRRPSPTTRPSARWSCSVATAAAPPR